MTVLLVITWSLVQSLNYTTWYPSQFKMSHCDRFPIPSNPAHHCHVCQLTPGKTDSAGLHYTKDCPLLPPEMQSLISTYYSRILINRHTVLRDQNVQSILHIGLRINVNVVEAYYQLHPSDPQPGPKSDYPTPHNPNHHCTRCTPGSGRENFVLKDLNTDGDQLPHF